MAISGKYALQRVFNVTVKDPATGKPYGKLESLQNVNLSNGQETVALKGGVGNPTLALFNHSKSFKGEMTSAIYDAIIEGLVNGTEAVKGTKVMPYDEVLTVNADKALTTATAVGTAGAEIIYVAVQNDDGSFGTVFEQAGTVAAGKFTYTSATKLLTFNTGEVANGTKIAVFYKVNSGASSLTLKNETNKFSRIVSLELNTKVVDVCTQQEYACLIEVPKAKFTGEYATETASDGDPASMKLDFEAIKASCVSNDLYIKTVYDESELA